MKGKEREPEASSLWRIGLFGSDRRTEYGTHMTAKICSPRRRHHHRSLCREKTPGDSFNTSLMPAHFLSLLSLSHAQRERAYFLLATAHTHWCTAHLILTLSRHQKVTSALLPAVVSRHVHTEMVPGTLGLAHPVPRPSRRRRRGKRACSSST